MAHFTFDFLPKSLARKVNVDLYLPSLSLHGALTNKDENYYLHREETYPLIIFLHGFGDNKEAFQNNTRVLALLEQYHCAGCFINGENKWYLNMGPIDNFDVFLEKDLPDFLYGNFRNLSIEKPLILAGVSMGGYGALYHYLNHTERYAAAVALSPATKPDTMKEEDYGLRKFFLQNKEKDLNIYLSVGTKDFIIQACRDLDSFLKENDVRCSYRYVENADHSWVTWAEEIYPAFDYLFKLGFIG